MSRSIKRIGGWGFGVAVAGALAFGASVAAAKPANAMTCANDGWNWLGYYPTESECYTACLLLHPSLDHVRYTPEGCCTCYF